MIPELTISQYALQGRNYSTLKFLITMVEDIDALEVNDSKRQMLVLSLNDFLHLYFSSYTSQATSNF